MKLSEELKWRGFSADTTFKNLDELDETSRKFYLGVDPSADSMTIGNLAALMMARVFTKHGYAPHLLIGGATGQIGDPKENEERNLKPLEEIKHNKSRIVEQFKIIVNSENLKIVDNNDWFSEIKFIPFLREVGKHFSMTQLLDREFVKSRIGEGGVGISYAEFSYTLIQGYDFLHLFRTEGITLQLCGADQFGNCVSGMQLIRKLENAKADVYACPLIVDKVSGKKFGKSEGNAVWLSADRTSVYNFYQFWLNQPDTAVEDYLKIYTSLEKPGIDEVMSKHSENPALRLAQKSLAYEVTKLIHSQQSADSVVKITTALFGDNDITTLDSNDLNLLETLIPTAPLGSTILEALVSTNTATSNSEAKILLAQNSISLNGAKISSDQKIESLALLKKGKNKFILIK
jgi:tyrosyl-tRNA synthetase